MHTSAGAITIPDNPIYIHRNLDCTITINIKSIDHIILRWIEFGPYLFPEISSCQNYIAVYKGIINSTNLFSKICNSSNTTTIVVKSSHLVNIQYQIQNYNHLKNFRFFYLGGKYLVTDEITISARYGKLLTHLLLNTMDHSYTINTYALKLIITLLFHVCNINHYNRVDIL